MTSGDSTAGGGGWDAGRQRFAAAIVGLVLGQLVGNNSFTIAKVLVYLRDQPYTRLRIAEVSLEVAFVLAGVGACFGAFATRRGWASFEQVATSVFVAAVVVFFTIVDYSLPVVYGDEGLRFGEVVYYLGWIVGLWLAPFFLLPSPDGTFAGCVRRGGGVLVVATAMGVAGLVVGGLVEGVASLVLESYGWLGGGSFLNDSQRFWMARPITIDAICSTYIAVAFAGFWWRGLWRSVHSASLWLAGMSGFAVLYAGVYGWFFYADEETAATWRFVLAFGTLPAAAALNVLAAYRLTRRKQTEVMIGWPVSGRFWSLIPVGLAFSFGAIALLGLGPIARYEGAVDQEIVVLVVAHAGNGVALGLTLRIMTRAFKLIPEGEGAVVVTTGG